MKKGFEIPMYDPHNAVDELKKFKKSPKTKIQFNAIIDVLRHFEVIA